MKTLFSILIGLLIAASSIALAMHTQQEDPLCKASLHEGFIVENDGTPPPGSSPENLPPNMESAGIFQENFTCDQSEELCHWVYNPTEQAWKPCKGDLRVIPN